MQSILNRHAPCRVKRIRNTPSPWMNKQLKHEINTTNYLKKKAGKSNSPSDWLLFKKK